jgi:ribosome-binding factor A
MDESSTDRKPFDAGSDRKTLQLCRQVERAISLGLSGLSDEVLRNLVVDGVSPMGSAGHLLVRVIVPADVSVHDVMRRLEARSAALRAEVAASICRKRVPALSFIPIAAGRSEVPHE